ncbi:mycofactocin biosynthesis peptidyl-dipeptidase MftE [Prauserella muralis]|uniref:Mycofactocin system creatininase family protein n=1 Tax=Prauserella muralis TaxID=588067 RepID=A0A2V4B1E5_9PSEU|nr:mycofactocin biosynthesis peptidyl-dipeptidase MftE [Prauserella muralis]PXY26965.1 mycofactocin system creatininase family protein [Prauserella muralis]TWE23419.1 creatinine amidohydrolase [Prauserella muralis]
MTALGSRVWPGVGPSVLAVPLGATEQHGPHLPLDTDTTIAAELCRRLAGRVPDVLVAPALPYGSSGEHAGFPGTLSIGRSALEHVLVELVRSADHFAGVVLVNGHGGNLAVLRRAVRTLREEGRRVLAWSPSGRADDTHAGRTETSVLLRLRPADVRLEAAEPGVTTPLPDLLDRLVAGGVRAVSPNGVLGDPAGASAEEGEAVLAAWADALAAAVHDWLGR